MFSQARRQHNLGEAWDLPLSRWDCRNQHLSVPTKLQALLTSSFFIFLTVYPSFYHLLALSLQPTPNVKVRDFICISTMDWMPSAWICCKTNCKKKLELCQWMLPEQWNSRFKIYILTRSKQQVTHKLPGSYYTINCSIYPIKLPAICYFIYVFIIFILPPILCQNLAGFKSTIKTTSVITM